MILVRATFRLLLVSLLLLLLGACATVVQLPEHATAAPAVPLADALQGSARVLQRHVNEHGEVDFMALRDDASDAGLPALEHYVRAIAATPIDASSSALPGKPARLAHMINAYNALSMYNVVASGIPATHAGLAKVRFFVLRKFDVGGAVMSLYDFENDIIRKQGDPRIHFALNCLAVSCPVLPRTPFTAELLDEELQREAKAFFARPHNLRLEAGTHTVFFNEILKFYTEDFVPAHAPNLIAYAQQFTGQPLPRDYAVAFTPYDWTVANSQRPR